jgi:two-component system, NarL family, sensor histidine kinase UhpB
MNRSLSPLNILVIEDNPGDYVLLDYYLKKSQLPVQNTVHVLTMASVAALGNTSNFDIVLLDLTLPDSQGIESVKTLSRLLPPVPIVVFSGISTREIAMQSISLGVQDYLVKGEFDEQLLAKTIRYGIERKRITEKLRESLERYEMVNKATQDAIWEWDLQTNEIRRNLIFTQLFGYTNDKVKNNNDWATEKIHTEDKERVMEIINQCINAKLDNWQAEYRYKTIDGTYREVYDRAYLQFNENGIPCRMIGAMTDLTENKRLKNLLSEQKLFQQRELLDANIKAHEEEKNELGKELHDNINQMLATVKMYLGLVRSDHCTDPAGLINKSYEYLEYTMDELRKLSHSLVSPSLGDIGLRAALQELTDNFGLVSDLQVKLIYNNDLLNVEPDKHTQLMIYRIVQEQLINVVKHAEAKNVIVSLQRDQAQLVLSVADDGIGFNATKKSKGIGLKNISNRIEFYSGTLEIITAPGKGCTLKANIPIINKTEL